MRCVQLCLHSLPYVDFTISLIFTGLLCKIVYFKYYTEFSLNHDNSYWLESEILQYTKQCIFLRWSAWESDQNLWFQLQGNLWMLQFLYFTNDNIYSAWLHMLGLMTDTCSTDCRYSSWIRQFSLATHGWSYYLWSVYWTYSSRVCLLCLVKPIEHRLYDMHILAG